MRKLRKKAAKILQRSREIGSDLLYAVMHWPIMTKITVPVSVICMLVGAVLLADLLHKDFATTVQADAIGTEFAGTEEPVYIAEIETEAETEMEISPHIVVSLPNYLKVSMVSESVEKDLTLYIEGENEENIKGVPFQVKLIKPKDLEQIQASINAIGETDITDFQIPEEYQGAELTEDGILTLKKQAAIAAYAKALTEIDGNVYTDEDSDGVIYIDSISAGEYTACFVPIMQYDASQYAVSVTVKDKVEYKPVETIEKKVVTAAVAGDKKTSHEVPVEAVKEDTTSEVNSSVEVQKAQYSTPQKMDLGIEAFLSDKKNEVTVECIMEPSGSSESTEEGSLQENGGTEQAEIIKSVLSIREEIRLYANPEAFSLVIPYTASEVTNIELTASKELSCIKIIGQTGGYLVSIDDPLAVTKDLSGTLTLHGFDALGREIRVTCKVTIVGADNKLTNAEAEQLYFADASGQMVEATVGNYSSSNSYCVEIKPESMVYYGWQTIDGITYYYNDAGAAVTGTQTIGGVTYYFDSDGRLLTAGTGIDVSKWQGTIDWEKASSAISFAIIRCGFRGTSGKLAKDPTFAANIAGAKENGVKVGIYFYSMAMTEAQAVEEASLAISLAKESGGLDLPIFIDMEDSCQLKLTTAQRDAIALAFCKTVQNSGYKAGVYANKNWLTTNLTPSKYDGITIWCAQYNTSCTYSGRYEIWQYSDKGKIPGIDGYVDMNQGYF